MSALLRSVDKLAPPPRWLVVLRAAIIGALLAGACHYLTHADKPQPVKVAP